MQNAENIQITNCLFDQVGGNGVFISGYNQYHVIKNCIFNDAGASCVCLFGLPSSVRCAATGYGIVGSCTDVTPGPKTPEFPAYVLIDNNMMNHLGRFEKQPAGVALSATQGDTIRHNTIHDCPRAGICFCDGCFGGHDVEYNWIYNCIQETGDHGPWNAWGRDRNWQAQGDSSKSRLDAWQTTLVHNNRFEAPNGDFGIDCDDGASNYKQYNNLLFGGGLKLQWNRYNTYLNNIVARQGTVQFHGTWAQSHHYAARNVLFGHAIYGQCCWSGDVPSGVKANVMQFDSNVVFDPQTAGNLPYMAPWGGTSVSYTWAQWTGAGNDTHSKVQDPMFTDTNKTWPNYQPVGDWSVKTGSPALTLGFQNFPMDSFGVMGTIGLPPPGQQARFFDISPESGVRSDLHVAYASGRLIVAHEGWYKVTITTALGKTVAVYNGKGVTNFAFRPNAGAGMYFASVRMKSGVETRRFMVNE